MHRVSLKSSSLVRPVFRAMKAAFTTALMLPLLLHSSIASSSQSTKERSDHSPYSPIQESILRDELKEALAIGRRVLLEDAYGWDDRRAVINLLSRPSLGLIDADRFESAVIPLDQRNCEPQSGRHRECKGDDTLKFLIRDIRSESAPGGRSSVALQAIDRGVVRLSHELALRSVYASRGRFGPAIHLFRDKQGSGRTYFIIREIEDKIGIAGASPVRQVLSFFLLSKSQSCKIGEAMVGRHMRFYEYMVAVVKLFWDSLSCEDRLIQL